MSDREPIPEQESWQQRLRDLRILMGWSQRRTAKEFRVTPAAISQWESGQRPVPGPIQRLVEVYERDLGMVDPPAPRGAKKVNGSWADRTLRASAMTARVAGRMAGSSIRSLLASNVQATRIKAATQTAIAEQVAESLGELKGGLMKVGQLLSYVGADLAEPAREALRILQDEAPPIDAGAVNGVFVETFGDVPERVFARWNPIPIAAASIGQVHEATTHDGREVAVKVQYPGIGESILADLRNAAAIERIAGFFFRHQDRGVLVREIRERLTEECDYRTEAGNQEHFRDILADDDEALVPAVLPELSNERVLTSERVYGARFAAFVREATQEQKDRAGEIIFRVAFGCIFRHSIFNADPHPGNYIFTPDDRVAFLDFGCVRRYSDAFVQGWKRLVCAVRAGDREATMSAVSDMGFIPDIDKVDADYVLATVRELHEPWLSSTPFRFNRHYVDGTWRAMVTENPHRYAFKTTAEGLFTNRLQWGLYNVLADLEAQADWRAIINELLPES